MHNNTALIDKLEKARLKIFVGQPYLGFILQYYEVILCDDIDTAATNGDVILFGISFLEKLSMNETIFVLLHELLHIVLLHPNRKDDRDSYRFNVAADIVVNDILIDYRFNYEKLPIITGNIYKLHGINHTVESIYDKLPKELTCQLLDGHHLWGKGQVSEERLKDIMKKAREQGYNQQLSGRDLNDLYGNQQSKNNWHQILKDILVKSVKDYTFQKIDQRFPDILLPSYTEFDDQLTNIWFLVDVSRSMNNQDVISMFAEINSIIKPYQSVQCEISFFSTKVTKPVRFSNAKELIETMSTIQSTGGTSFTEIFDSVDVYYSHDKPKAMLILTDGYAKFPVKNPFPSIAVFWCINNLRVNPKFGITVRI
jgi:predicted metal-dependent peptidase